MLLSLAVHVSSLEREDTVHAGHAVCASCGVAAIAPTLTVESTSPDFNRLGIHIDVGIYPSVMVGKGRIVRFHHYRAAQLAT